MRHKEDDAAPVEIAIAVVERDGQMLIGLRGRGKPLAGLWEFPGGKLLEGESPEDAARRECWEETGVGVRITGRYPSVTYDYPHARVTLHFFACEVLDEPQSLPVHFRWVPRAELGKYSFPPANAALLAELGHRANVA
jgi:8-oxo-dGTP diphosphatase